MSTAIRYSKSFRAAVPALYDPAELRKFSARIGGDQARQHAARTRGFVQRMTSHVELSALQGRLTGLDPQQAEPLARKMQQKIRAASREIKPDLGKVLGISGHNPSRYPPYEAAGLYSSRGGIHGFELRGPDSTTGATGAMLWADTGGHASTEQSVGFFLVPTADATLNVTVNAFAMGVATVYSTLFGYAAAYAAIRASICQWSPYLRVHAETAIYDARGPVVADIWRNPSSPGFDSYSASISLPVRRGALYYISGGAVQSVAAGGLLFPYAKSSFHMPVRPIDWNLL